jgi:hypothetical protein
MRIKILRVKT